MARYLVTMGLPQETTPDGALPPIEGLLGIVGETILPAPEALSDLERRGAVPDGGYPSGKRGIMIIVEADSEEGVREMLGGVPGWEAESAEVSRLRTLEELPGRGHLRAV